MSCVKAKMLCLNGNLSAIANHEQYSYVPLCLVLHHFMLFRGAKIY